MAKKHRGLQQALASQQARARAQTAENTAAREARIKSDKGKQKASVHVTKPFLPFRAGQSILLCGEANFSFALALVSHHLPDSGASVVATTLDSRQLSAHKYPDMESNIAQLEQFGVTVLFEVDATALDKVKQLKGMQFHAIVFNFPHVGAGEKDHDRNIRLNQVLILMFLRACPPFLAPDTGRSSTNRKRKRPEAEFDISDGDEAPLPSGPGCVYVTLRNAKPYTLWDLPLLAKKGPALAPTLLPFPYNRQPPSSQPVYRLERSFAFPFDAYPGYAHRRTIGFQPGLSTEDSQDARLPSKQRRKHDDAVHVTGGEARTWQLALQTS